MDAAERVILTEGADALTADRLAEVSGVSRRTIFNHFNSVVEVAHARMSQYLVDLRGTYEPAYSDATTGFEAKLLSDARAVFTPENVEKYLGPTTAIALKLIEAGQEPNSWEPQITYQLSQQTFEKTLAAYPNAKPVHLKVIVKLFINIIEGGLDLWAEQYFTAQEQNQPLPNMEDLHHLIHEGFDYVQVFVNAAPTTAPECK